MSILRHFGLENIADELLADDGVHNLGNLLSLGTDVHDRFDNLELWFEGTDEVHYSYYRFPSGTNLTHTQPNRYNVRVSDVDHMRYLRMFGHLHAGGGPLSVTFSSNYKDARLPNPQLLALHAACARVAHMSGAAETFYELERDVEDTRVLAFDGSSARLLDHLMIPFATIPGVA